MSMQHMGTVQNSALSEQHEAAPIALPAVGSGKGCDPCLGDQYLAFDSGHIRMHAYITPCKNAPLSTDPVRKQARKGYEKATQGY